MLLELLKVFEPFQLLLAFSLDVSQDVDELLLRAVVVFAGDTPATLFLWQRILRLFDVKVRRRTVQFRQICVGNTLDIVCTFENQGCVPFRVLCPFLV